MRPSPKAGVRKFRYRYWLSPASRRTRNRAISGANAFHGDWLTERGGLETSVSREVFPRENGCERSRFLVSKLASILQRMKFAVSSVRFPSATLEFRCRENAAGLTTNFLVDGWAAACTPSPEDLSIGGFFDLDQGSAARGSNRSPSHLSRSIR